MLLFLFLPIFSTFCSCCFLQLTILHFSYQFSVPSIFASFLPPPSLPFCFLSSKHISHLLLRALFPRSASHLPYFPSSFLLSFIPSSFLLLLLFHCSVSSHLCFLFSSGSPPAPLPLRQAKSYFSCQRASGRYQFVISWKISHASQCYLVHRKTARNSRSYGAAAQGLFPSLCCRSVSL